jgi:hypothetical protein
MAETKIIDRNPRAVLDETATSIRKLVGELENREREGTLLTAREIQAIAGQLQGHVEVLLAAAGNLREETCDESSGGPAGQGVPHST